jgi:hypothetical protein
MGLLDDAIREHLDLKRRHGADPTEIDQAERDALGPVRRGPMEVDDLPLEPATAGDEDLAYDEEDEHQLHEPFPAEAERREPFLDQPETAEPPAPGLLESEHEPGESWAYDEEAAPEEPLSDRPPAPRAPEPHPAGHVGQETAEYNVENEHEPDKAGDEILEETPEFLQDAPDHDRLWFEQRPPRDFDFDR